MAHQKCSTEPQNAADREDLADQFSKYAEKWGQEAAAAVAAQCLIGFAVRKQTNHARFSGLAGEVFVRVEQPDKSLSH